MSRVLALIAFLLPLAAVLWLVDGRGHGSRDAAQVGDTPRSGAASTSLARAQATPAALSAPRAAPAAIAGWIEESRLQGGAFAEFAEWMSGGRSGGATEGLRLAEVRREAMRGLIRSDPARALTLALPHEARRELDESILARSETPVSVAGEFRVVITCDEGSGAALHDHASHEGLPCPDEPVVRTLSAGGRTWRVYPYGERLATTSKDLLGAWGVAIDDELALGPSPLRLLSDAEARDRGLDASAGVPIEIAGQARLAEDDASLLAWMSRLQSEERRLGPAAGPSLLAALDQGSMRLAEPAIADAEGGTSGVAPEIADSAWTEGAKTILYIRARFADEDPAFEPVALSTVQAHQATVAQYWVENSYGKIPSVTTTFTDVVTLPRNGTYYPDQFNTLLSEARSAAQAANPAWNSANFSLYVVVTSDKGNFPYAGRAFVGSSGAHLVVGYTSLRTAGHEFGHNLGLWHANYWRTDSTSPIGRDSVPGGYVSDGTNDEWIEYGHRFSVMSAQSGTDFDNASRPHYAVSEKFRLDWLTTAAGVTTLTSTPAGGTIVRLYRQDHASATGTRALRIDLPTSDPSTTTDSNKRRYWLSYRRAFASGTTGTFSPHGVQVDWQRNTYGSDGAVQLDMTPFTSDSTTYSDAANRTGSWWTIDNADKEDAMLPIGLTWSDPAGIHFTPVATGDDDGTAGNGNEWIEVDVRVGSFAGNRAPTVTLAASTTTPGTGQAVTLTATASDPDGDPLSVWWDFGDRSVVSSSFNSLVATKSWGSAAVRTVRVVVSDRRGGQASAFLTITIGSPTATREIRGRVIHGGLPVQGARVSAGTTAASWTDSDGRYVLPGLAAGNHVLAVRKEGLTFTAQFTNPVSTASGNAYGRDFFANELLPGTAAGSTTTISGTIRSGTRAMAGVVVEAAGIRTTTGSNGTYVLSGLPAGTHAVVPRFPHRTFSPTVREVVVGSSGMTGQDFAVAGFTVSGRVTGIPSGFSARNDPPRIFLLDGTEATTTRVSNQGWDYTITVPAGTFSLHATRADYLLTPGFGNPLTIAAGLSSRNFSGASGTQRSIQGRVSAHGRGLAGVTVSLAGGNTATTTTDIDGRYRFEGLAGASTTVSASREGYVIVAGGSATVTPGELTLDFSATGNTPTTTAPVVTQVSASSSSVPAGVPVMLSASASGPGPLVYRWGAITASGPVTFAANASAEASSTSATFTIPGAHVIEVEVEDANGRIATGTVSLSVTSGAGRLVVSPYEVVADAGTSVTFKATAFDSTGAVTPASVTYAVSGNGTMDPATGLFVGKLDGNATVTTTVGAMAAQATIRVVGSLPEAKFDTWVATAYPTLTGEASAPDADPDNDGVPNLLEYALGGDPTAPGSAGASTTTVIETLPDQPRLAIGFVPARFGLTYTVEATGDFVTWTPVQVFPGGTDTPVVVEDTVPLSPGTPRFLRIVVQ